MLFRSVNNATGQALVEVYDLTEAAAATRNPVSNLFFAPLRPAAGAPGSLASGFAAISFAPDGSAKVSLNISNLSSAQTAAYLRLAGTDDYILSLPLGQVMRPKHFNKLLKDVEGEDYQHVVNEVVLRTQAMS